jgi:putative flippase GtrA
MYLLTGATATVFDIGLYLILLWSDVWYIAASVTGGVAGFFSAFLLHKYVAFKKPQQIQRHFARFCLLSAWNIVATNAILYMSVDVFGIPEEPSKVLSNAAVVLWNFFCYKYFVYV